MPPKTCIFCGGSRTTNAHIFRKAWLDQVFPGAANFDHRHVRRSGASAFDRTWSKSEPDIKVNSVCDACNSGWMSRLDRQAEDLFLDQAVRGYPVKLQGRADMTTLARWCLLVATLCDQTQAVPIVPSATHRAVYGGDVPDGVHMWVFRTEPPPWQIAVLVENRTWRMDSASGEAGDAYFLTFGVGHFVAQVFVPTERTPEFDRGPNRAMYRDLWPAPLTPLVWPPPQTTPWDQMGDLSDAFQGPMA